MKNNKLIKLIAFIFVIILLLLSLTGCENNNTVNNTNVNTEVSKVKKEILYTYNPHVYSKKLAESYSKDYWTSFYNLCDALRKGEDTFNCSSKEIYDWCLDPVTLNNLFPTACVVITGKSNDKTTPYENGIGRIYYKIPKEEYVQRQTKFEEEVTDILNSYLKYDYSDFEKCLKLYDYMISNYHYNHGDITTPQNYGATYYCYVSKSGICCDFGSLYAYLLLQVNVDALLASNTGGDHAWTYVTIDGKGYHIDPTWGLKEFADDKFTLDYFMMTDADREADDDFPREKLQIALIPEFYAIDSPVDYSASSEKYACFRGAFLEKVDLEKNILYYTKFDDVAFKDKSYEFKYE